MTSSDPGPYCGDEGGFCEYGDFYQREGIVTPRHDCPAPAPLEPDDLDGELSELERGLLVSLHRAFGVESGRIRYLDRRKR